MREYTALDLATDFILAVGAIWIVGFLFVFTLEHPEPVLIGLAVLIWVAAYVRRFG